MKALTQTTTKVDASGNVTITGKLIDVNFPAIVGQRHSIQHPVNGQTHKPRKVEANTHGVVIKRFGSSGFLFPKEELTAIAMEADLTLTDPPLFIEQPSAKNLVGKIASEIQATAQIEVSTDGGKTWSNAPDNATAEVGKSYRVIATNANGSTTSDVVSIRAPKQSAPK